MTAVRPGRPGLFRREVDLGRLVRGAAWTVATSGRVAWILVAVGVLLRVGAYAHGRDYWQDEGALQLNIVGKPPFALLDQLQYSQVAPPGFLVLERMVAAVLGGSPYALRLVPLAAGVAALVLFHPLAFRILDGPSAAIAVGLLAFSDDLIYYSTELKPYIVEVAFAVAALRVGLWAASGRRPAREWSAALGFGLVSPWFSFGSAFLLPVVAAVWWVSAAWRGDLRDRSRAVAVALAWGASGLGSLLIARAMLANHAGSMNGFWGFAFLPIPPRSTADAAELLRHALNLFGGPGRVALPFRPAATAAVGLVLAAVGAVLLAVDRRAAALALLLGPIALHSLASSRYYYPFHGRLVLYLAPALLLLIARTIGAIRRRTPTRVLRVAVVVFVFAVPVLEAAGHLADSYSRPFDRHGDLRHDPF